MIPRMSTPEERPKKLARRLAPVLEQLQRQSVVESVTHRQQQNRSDLIENLVQRQQQAALVRELNRLNKADIGHLLNMLPADKRHTVWQELPDETAGDVLLELNDAVAEDLIELTDEARNSDSTGDKACNSDCSGDEACASDSSQATSSE